MRGRGEDLHVRTRSGRLAAAGSPSRSVWSRSGGAFLARARAGSAALDHVPVLGLIVAVVVIRLLADVVISAGSVDTYEFGIMADRIDAGQGFAFFGLVDGLPTVESGAPGTPLPSAYMPPIYVAVTAAASFLSHALGGGQITTVWLVRVVNVVLAVVAALGIHRLVEIIAWRRAAQVAVVLFAVYPTVVYQVTQVSAANAYLAVEIWLLVGLALLADRAFPRRIVGVAVLVGALCLLRSEAVLLLVVLPVWLWWRAGTERGRRARMVALFLTMAVLLPGAWMIRSSVVLGAPVPTITTTGGYNFWVGNHEGASGSQKDVVIPEELQRRVDEITPTNSYELQRDALFRSAAASSVLADPLGVAGRDLEKLGLMLGVDVYDQRSDNPAYLASYAVVLVLGSAGAVRWWRLRADEPGPRRAHARIMVGYVILTLAVPTVFFALARYKVPWEVTLLMATAVLLARSPVEGGEPGPADDASVRPAAAGQGSTRARS